MADERLPELNPVVVAALTDIIAVRQSGDIRDKRETLAQLLGINPITIGRVRIDKPAIGGVQGSSLTLFSNNPQFTIEQTVADPDEKVWNWVANAAGELKLRLLTDLYTGTDEFLAFTRSGTTPVSLDVNADLITKNLAMAEKAAAPADVTGTGQFWVRDDVPNTPMFTDDAGTDFELNAGLANDSVQARRSTSFTLSTAFVDVTLSNTDVETDAAVIEHDNTNTDDIDIKVTGVYRVTVGADIDPSVASEDTIIVNARVRLNDAGTGIAGSLASTGSFTDASILGEDSFNRISINFITSLTAGDFLTLQMSKTEIGGTGVFTMEETTVTVERLT